MKSIGISMLCLWVFCSSHNPRKAQAGMSKLETSLHRAQRTGTLDILLRQLCSREPPVQVCPLQQRVEIIRVNLEHGGEVLDRGSQLPQFRIDLASEQIRLLLIGDPAEDPVWFQRPLQSLERGPPLS